MVIRALHSLDIAGLEESILERVVSRPRGGLLDPLLVLVPTRRLAAHLKRRIAERAGAALGVHLLTHRGLAVRALEHALETPPRLLPSAALLALLEKLLEEVPGPEADYLRSHAGARSALLSTLKDLREAGLEPRELSEANLTSEACPAYLPALYQLFAEALERLEPSGWIDSAGLIRASLPHVPAYLRRKKIREAIHHGAYELIGIHLELLEAVGCAAKCDFLLPTYLCPPAGAGGSAFGYSSRFAERLRSRGIELEPASQRSARREGWLERLRRLHDPEAIFPPLEPREGPALEIQSAQGAEAELRAAALRALAAHSREGVPLHEIAIVARSLEPYAPFLESTFEELKIPFTSSATAPLALDQGARVFLGLLRVLGRDFERRAVIDLLRRGRLRFADGAPDPADIDRWDRWSRGARLASGLSGWRELSHYVEALTGAEEEDPSPGEGRLTIERGSVERLQSFLRELEADRKRWLEAQSFSEHAAFLRGLAQRRIPPQGPETSPEEELPPAIQRIVEALEAAGRAQEAALGRSRGHAPPPAASLEEVEELSRLSAELESTPIHDRDEGGLRVLDLMQARGLTHRVVVWIGFHDGLFPRRASADLFLADEARAALADQTGKPLGSKLEAAHEDRLLLALTLSSVGERLILSFQRSDEDGARLARSSALREVARVFLGRPEAAALLEDHPQNHFRPEVLSAHPGEQASQLARSSRIGLLPSSIAVAGAAVRARHGAGMARVMLAELESSREDLDSMLSCLERMESFEPGDGDFDGATGLGIEAQRRVSPTAIERLARCPLSFFLRDVLGLREIEEEAVPHRIEHRALGQAAHAALAALYQTLEREGWFQRGENAAARALELLPRLFGEGLQRAAGSSYQRLVSLFEILGERWLKALSAFVRLDLEEICEAGVRRISVEEWLSAGIPLAPGLTLELGGRLDRVMRLDQGVWVDDYKTRGKLGKKVQPKEMLKGLSLQLPLYRELAARTQGVEPLRVQARLLPVGPEADQDPAVLGADPELRKGILQAVAVALRLARYGRFPLFPSKDSPGYCSFCGYRRTCRKNHEPTLTRLAADRFLGDFRKLREKSSGRRALREEQAATARAPGEPEEGDRA